MKKFIVFILLFVTISSVQAQTDSTLQQYTGKYKFQDGSPVPEISMVIENGLLMGNSAIGSSEFKKRDGDVFDIVAYSGTATFRRGSDGKINGVYIEVGDTKMEGSKTELQFTSSQVHKFTSSLTSLQLTRERVN